MQRIKRMVDVYKYIYKFLLSGISLDRNYSSDDYQTGRVSDSGAHRQSWDSS